MAAAGVAVSVEAVSHRYGAKTVLAEASVTFPSGSMTALVGPDGAGKSTLLSLIAGSRRLVSGEIRVLGADMRQAQARDGIAPRIAFMPQGLGKNLYPTLSVVENIDFFGRLFAQSATERRARIERLLAATGLAPFPHRPAGKLSGGMKQKLSLCCALVHEPDLLILDEPTTGVDPLSRRQFWALIDALRAERPEMTVIVATAYMEEAARFDWLVAMNAGRVLATGTTEDLLSRTGADNLDAAFIALLPAEDRGEFLEALGLEESGLARVIRAGYKLLGLKTFFTAGPKEARAWTFPDGAKAPPAAGEIHSDFERGFIRAETIAYDDYVTLGGEAGAKEAGKLRQEGKEYVVQDGDVLLFKFNV